MTLYDAANDICQAIVLGLRSAKDLIGNTLDVQKGTWINKSGGIGAGCDSFFEYLLKAGTSIFCPSHHPTDLEFSSLDFIDIHLTWRAVSGEALVLGVCHVRGRGVLRHVH
jgi:hypothetical protein